MQIKKLIIKNFKSFKYTAIPFKKGFHTIVGPNGSGKSNIIDALLFVFGATSLKRLRVDKLANLVNHNSSSNTARVRVVFEHENQDYEIAREIDKEGKSIFYLNNKRKALNEITSFLHSLAISAQGYNTVQQGDVTRIINLKPEERREIIEEVSGISLFDERKKEAEFNLKKVDKRLNKVSIALNERKPYVEQLKSEKESAIKYNEYDFQEKNLNYNLINKELKDLKNKNQVLENNIEEDSYKIEEINKSKAEYLNKKNELEKKIEDINSKLINFSENVQNTIGNKYSTLKANKEIVDNNLELKNKNVEHLKVENNEAVNQISLLKNEKSELNKIIEEQTNKLEKIKEEKNILKNKINSNKEEYILLKEKQQELYNNLNKINKKISEKQDLYFREENKINAYNFQLENLKKEEEKNKKYLDSFKDKDKELNKDISSLRKEISSITKQKEDLLNNKNNLEKSKKELEENINSYNIELATLNKEKQITTNAISKIKEIKSTLNSFNTFVGFLDDCLSLDNDQKTYYANYVVLKNSSEIKDILKKLDNKITLSFVILDVLKISKKELNNYFKNKNNLKYVKPIKGFYFDGFSYKKILFKDSKTIDKKISKLETKLNKDKGKLETIIEELSILNNKINTLEEKLINKNISLNTNIEILDDLSSKIEEYSNIVSITSKKTIVQNVGQIKTKKDELESELDNLKNKKEDLQKQLSSIDLGTQTNLRDKYDDLISIINNLEQSLISKRSNLEIINSKLNSKQAYIKENNIKIDKYNNEINDLKDKLTTLNNNIKDLEIKLENEEHKKKSLFDKKKDFNNSLNNIYQVISNLDNKIQELNSNINSYNIELSTNSSKISQLETNLELLDLKEENKKDINLTIDEIKSKLRKLRREKNALGNINFNAIESYDKLAKEYNEIQEKYNILIEEKKEVKSLLTKINMKKETIFIDCFNIINKEFKKIISQMSKSLSGNLKLEGKEILNSKLIINLTKNRKTKDIDIMSGGEKTITALAFIFAINSYKKLPFYILDEVDAALDDLNSKNLMNYLKELSKNSNIICITHNDTLINGSNQVIGVTLKDHSSVIGLDL
jgi:chromosome segregation protein